MILENKLIQENIKSKNISHAYLIETNGNNSADQFVYQFVKELLDPSNQLDLDQFLLKIECDELEDLKIIRADAAVIKKEQLIELQKEFNTKSINASGKRVYIVFEAEKLNQSSGNSMLKFLEEPKDDIVAILVSSNRYKILPTILSRCRIITLPNTDTITVSKEAEQFIRYLLEEDSLVLKQNEIIKEIMVDKHHAKQVLKEVEYYLFDLYKQITTGKEDINIDGISIDSKIILTKVPKYITILEENFKKMNYNINYKLWLDCFLVELKEV